MLPFILQFGRNFCCCLKHVEQAQDELLLPLLPEVSTTWELYTFIYSEQRTSEKQKKNKSRKRENLSFIWTKCIELCMKIVHKLSQQQHRQRQWHLALVGCNRLNVANITFFSWSIFTCILHQLFLMTCFFPLFFICAFLLTRLSLSLSLEKNAIVLLTFT